MYLVTKTFTDLVTGHKYEMGDEYPAKGTETTAERINELASGNNKAGLKLIKAVKAPKEAEPVKETKPKKKSPKKSGGKKKASK